MKKQLVSILFALCMVLCLVPLAAFAEESTETPPECSCETACTAESMNAECPVCGAEGVSAENCAKYIKPADGAAAQPEEKVSDPQPETALTALSGEGETPAASGAVTEVGNEPDLTAAIANSNVNTVKLTANIDISSSLTVNRTVTLDLNGYVLKYVSANKGSVIVVENGGQLTIEDSNTSNLSHKFMPNGKLWVLDDASGTEAVTGGVITGGTGTDISTFGGTTWYCGGGALIKNGGSLTMRGGNIIGCSAECGGGVCIDSEQGQFSMSGGSIAGCVASDIGGGVFASGTFKMSSQAVIRSCTAESATQYVCAGGVYVNVSSSFEMSDTAIIEGCQAISNSSNSSNGGGVYVSSSSSFVMSNEAKIEGCQAISNSSNSSNSSNGGGVYLSNNTRFTLSGSAVIQNCTATNSANPGEAYGGGVSAACVKEITLADSARIAGCTAANGSGLYITGSLASPNVYGKLYANGGSVDGDVVLGDKDKNDGPCTITGSGGTVFYGKVTVTPGSTIESGTFNGEVINNGTITGGTFSGGITGNPALATGSGTETDPYQIGTAEGLKRFRDIVNGENGRTQKLDACATLTADIVLNDGTFDEDGNYTPGPSSAALTEWSPMGVSNSTVYAGTFDGAGHTIQGVYCNSYRGASGLFGYIDGATIQGVRVTGYFNANNAEQAGCIAALAKSSRITGCVSTASINGHHSFQSSTGGIVGIADSSTQVSDCINYGTVKCTPSNYYATFAGGIVGCLADYSTVTNCSNFGTIIGLVNSSSTQTIYVGGIVGTARLESISDCYNAGAVRIDEQGNSSATQGAGGIAGYAGDDAQYLTHISNCYNVGSVTAANANAMLGGIVGRSGYDSVAITNCYYLTGTAGQVYGDGKATVTNTTEKSAFDFANGGVLALLMADRPADAQPWDTTCKYLESAGMTLPVLARQNLTVHDHVWSTYTTDTAAKTHTHSCACGVVETEACTITPATCKDVSACAVCGQQYGGLDPHNHADLQHFPAVAATTDAEGNKEYWYCGGCGKYFADAAAAREITQADTVTAKLPQPTTPPTATPTASPTAQPTTAPQAAEQPRRTAQPTVQPTAAPTVQPVSTIPATGDTSSPILWAALLLCSGVGLAVTAYKKNRHRA